jgi:cyclopropane-fatty-acyl-phospholipid synthase
MTIARTLRASATVPTAAPASARAVLHLLSRLAVGRLDVQLPDGSTARFGAEGAIEPHGALRLDNWNVCARRCARATSALPKPTSPATGAHAGPGRAAALFIANRESIESVVYGTWWGSLLHRLRHLLNRNSRRGSRKNIHAHYDLGNPSTVCGWTSR